MSGLPDFPWDREACWMRIEETHRAALNGIPSDIQNEMIDRLRLAFDTWYFDATVDLAAVAPTLARLAPEELKHFTRVLFELFNTHLWQVWNQIVRTEADRTCLEMRLRFSPEEE